jgi:hypothetical protein
MTMMAGMANTAKPTGLIQAGMESARNTAVRRARSSADSLRGGGGSRLGEAEAGRGFRARAWAGGGATRPLRHQVPAPPPICPLAPPPAAASLQAPPRPLT